MIENGPKQAASQSIFYFWDPLWKPQKGQVVKFHLDEAVVSIIQKKELSVNYNFCLGSIGNDDWSGSFDTAFPCTEINLVVL